MISLSPAPSIGTACIPSYLLDTAYACPTDTTCPALSKLNSKLWLVCLALPFCIEFYLLSPAKNLGHVLNCSISQSAVFRGKVLIPPLPPLLSSLKVSSAFIATTLTWTTCTLTVVSGIDILHSSIVYCCLFAWLCVLAKKPPVAKDNYLGLYLSWTSRWVLPFSWNLSLDSDWSESIFVSSFSLAVLLLRPMRHESILGKLFLPA